MWRSINLKVVIWRQNSKFCVKEGGEWLFCEQSYMVSNAVSKLMFTHTDVAME